MGKHSLRCGKCGKFIPDDYQVSEGKYKNICGKCAMSVALDYIESESKKGKAIVTLIVNGHKVWTLNQKFKNKTTGVK
jgi:nitrogen regulatory protein PII-like uncharacterized protein